MKINFWYNEGCDMWRWCITNDKNGATECFSAKSKAQAIFAMVNAIARLTDEAK